MNGRKLPIGIQSFESLRKEGFLYVDKTPYVYRLVHEGKPYFLSRPRRFGKSLLLSTLRAYWEGKKELFTGLAIEELEADNPNAWQPHPTFYFDFNKDNFQRPDALEDVLDAHLKEWEKQYGAADAGASLAARFQHLIVSAVEQTGKEAVVLVDEYDKALLETMIDNVLAEHNKAVFKGFFSTLKSYDQYLKFVFLTGVTKFSKVSIFSDLNQLRDISFDKEYAGICGITEEEIQSTFMPEIEAFADEIEKSTEECLAKLKKTYDGYHFHHRGEGVYNPFSLINALLVREFRPYWFETGTPTFLIKKLKQSDFDARKFTSGELYANARVLSDYRADNPDPIPLFYQTGYLTIKGYDDRRERYVLGYPNEEVKYGFLESLAPSYLHDHNGTTGVDIFSIDDKVEEGDLDGLKDSLIALFARIPYPNDEKLLERDFQNVIYIVFMLLGKFVHTEIQSSKGRADVIVETKDYIYLFEFKRDKSAEEALAQIEEKGYSKRYLADERILYKIGVNFDSKERTINEWEVRE